MYPPIAIHMDWATGQHIEHNDGIPSYRQERNAKLLLAAHVNLHREGLPFGECSDKREIRALRGVGGAFAPSRLMAAESGSASGGMDKEEWSRIMDRERRHGLLSGSLYRRPEGLIQTGHDKAMDTRCHAHLGSYAR